MGDRSAAPMPRAMSAVDMLWLYLTNGDAIVRWASPC